MHRINIFDYCFRLTEICFSVWRLFQCMKIVSVYEDCFSVWRLFQCMKIVSNLLRFVSVYEDCLKQILRGLEVTVKKKKKKKKLYKWGVVGKIRWFQSFIRVNSSWQFNFIRFIEILHFHWLIFLISCYMKVF